jgi:hypothetical protein
VNLLAFDPYAALAEIESASGLRANGANRANPMPVETPLAPLAQLALSPTPIRILHDPASDPVGWALALTRTDTSRVPAGYDPDRWRGLIDDARWLCRCHGDAAHGLGWTASDLFGVGAAPGWGGLADWLVGARKLLLTDRIAHWRGDDLEGWLWRQTMRPMPLIWEAMV